MLLINETCKGFLCMSSRYYFVRIKRQLRDEISVTQPPSSPCSRSLAEHSFPHSPTKKLSTTCQCHCLIHLMPNVSSMSGLHLFADWPLPFFPGTVMAITVVSVLWLGVCDFLGNFTFISVQLLSERSNSHTILKMSNKAYAAKPLAAIFVPWCVGLVWLRTLFSWPQSPTVM